LARQIMMGACSTSVRYSDRESCSDVTKSSYLPKRPNRHSGEEYRPV